MFEDKFFGLVVIAGLFLLPAIVGPEGFLGWLLAVPMAVGLVADSCSAKK